MAKEQKDFVCPKCFKRALFRDAGYICTNTNTYVNCENAKTRKIITFHSDKDVKKPKCDKCKATLSTIVCPNPSCGYEIPASLRSCESHSVAILGAKEVGKSNYITVLIDELYNKGSGNLIGTMRPADSNTLGRYRREFYAPLYENKTCVQGTDVGEATPLIYYLTEEQKKGLFARKQRVISLTFFDTAGENLDNDAIMKKHNGYLAESSSLLLLLDPLQIPTVRERLEGSDIRLPDIRSNPNDILTRVINMIIAENGLREDEKIDKDLAIVFTKIDAVESLLDASSCLKNNSSHLQKGGFDKVDFEEENGEMQSLVENWVGSGLRSLAEEKFRDVAFFGVSALGSNPDMNNRVPKFRPFRVADPFLWVLYKMGMIREV